MKAAVKRAPVGGRHCQCGRKIVTYPTVGEKRRDKARRKQPYRLKGHDLCTACWNRISWQARGKMDRMLAVIGPAEN